MKFQQLLLNISFAEIMWSDNTPIARMIILIILSLLAISLYVFWKQWLRFEEEEKGLRKVGQNLANWKDSFLDSKYEEEEGYVEEALDEDLQVLHQASIPLLQEGVQKGLIIYNRLSTLQENKITRSKINVAVLQNLAQLGENREWTAHFPKYVMTLSMLLGMLGTFIGLTLMVGDISEALKTLGEQTGTAKNINEFNSSFDGLRDTLGGVGTAFSTTLAGLVCTIVASALNYFLEQRRANFFNHLEQFTVQDLLPHTFPNLEEKTMLETIEDQLEDTFLNLNQTIEVNNAALGELNGLYKKFDSIEDTLRSVLTSGGASDIQGVIKELNTVNDSLGVMIHKYQNEQLLKDFRQLTDHHTKYVNSLNGILAESKWIPSTKGFLIAIAAFLFIIATLLGIQLFY